jgi:hypothetical protein
VTEAKNETKPRPPRVFENDLMDAEYARTVHVLKGLPGTFPENYLEPETWAHIPETKLRQGARIEITAEDGSWFCELLVRSRKGSIIHVEMLREHKFDAIDGKEHDAFDIEYAGKVARWRVMRRTDRAVLVDKLATKSEAVQWIEDQAGPLKQAA